MLVIVIKDAKTLPRAEVSHYMLKENAKTLQNLKNYSNLNFIKYTFIGHLNYADILTRTGNWRLLIFRAYLNF